MVDAAAQRMLLIDDRTIVAIAVSSAFALTLAGMILWQRQQAQVRPSQIYEKEFTACESRKD